jgi:hypothetical protein
VYPLPHSDEHGEEYARKNAMVFLETSALEGHNIDEAFNAMITCNSPHTQK